MSPWMLALPLLLSAQTALSTTSKPLTLAEVLAQADALHPTIVAASADVEAARAELLAAEGVFDPTLRARSDVEGGNYLNGTADAAVDVLTPLWGTRVEGGYRAGVGDFPTYDGKKKTNDFGEFRLGVAVPLLRDGFTDSRRATIEKLQLEQRARSEALRAARLEVGRMAASAWWDWVAAGTRLAIDESLLELALMRDSQLRRRADAGDLPAFEVTDNTRLMAARRSRVITARRALERTSLALAMYVRDDDGHPAPPGRERLPALSSSPSLPLSSSASSREQLLERATRGRPEARRARLQLEILAVDEALTDNQLLPGLSLTGSVSQDIGGTSDPLSSSSSVWNPDPKTRALPEGRVGLSFDLPIPQRAARGRSALVQALQGRARASLQLTMDRIALEVDDALQALTAAREREITTRAEVEAALSVADGERQRFEGGDSTLLLLNLREVAAAEARIAAADAVIDAGRAEVVVQLVSAGLLGEQ